MKRIYPHPYCAPALDFEKASGLSGIHTPWKMPEGLSYDAVENEALSIFWDVFNAVDRDNTKLQAAFNTTHPAQRDQLLASFDQLVELNPTLKALSFVRDNELHVSTVIGGVASQFNLNDLHFMVTSTPDDHKAYGDKRRAFEERTGLKVNWILSPQTFAEIDRQLDARAQLAGQAKSPAVKPGF